MIKKQQQFLIKGMNQDIAETKVQPELAHSIKNLRAITDEDSGTLSLVTEKGTQVKTFPNNFFMHSDQIYNDIIPTYYNFSIDNIAPIIMRNGNPYITNTMYEVFLRIKVSFKMNYSDDFKNIIIYEYSDNIIINTDWIALWNSYLVSYNGDFTKYPIVDYNKNTYTSYYNEGPRSSISVGNSSGLLMYLLKSYDNTKQVYTIQMYVPIYVSADAIPSDIFDDGETQDERISKIINYLRYTGTDLIINNNKLLKDISQSFSNFYPIFSPTIKYKSGNDVYTLSKLIKLKNILNTTVVNKDLIIFGLCSVEYYKRLEEQSELIFTLSNKSTIVKLIDFNNITPNSTVSDYIKFLYTGNLNFNINNPIKTYVSYESENQQRIYWIDGLNQPRVININKEYEFFDSDDDNHFNFCTPVYLNENINITKKVFGGFFHSGTIQYFITYIDQNQQESKVFYVSPLFYITNNDRALSPEEISQNSFVINIENANSNYLQRDKIRIYSIHRSSINATPVGKLVSEIQLKPESSNISIIDTGNIGINIDPQIILMAGCDLFVPKTMAVKDETMFFGNIKLENKGSYKKINQMHLNFECERATDDDIDSITSYNYNKMFISSSNSGINKFKSVSVKGALFKNDFQLNGFSSVESNRCYSQNTDGSDNNIKTFMYQEEYMLGIQLLHKSGEWSQPIWVGDYIMDKSVHFSPLIEIPIFQCFYSSTYSNTLLNNGYVAIRPLVVCNDVSTARVVCQGVVNPVLYDKNDGGEFSGSNDNYSTRYISSWFFRPVYSNNSNDYFGFGTTDNFAGNITTNNDFCKYGLAYLSPSGEIMNEVQNNDKRFKISEKIVSFNSPEIEFEKILELPKNIVANKIGYVTIQSLKYDLNIQTSTIPKDAGLGFNTDILKTKVMHYSFKNNVRTWCTFLGGLSWGDKTTISGTEYTYRWYVYPWENDQSYSLFEKTNEDIIYGAPLIKTLSNWRYSQENWYFNQDDIVKRDLKFSKIVNSNYTSIESFIYEKDIDKLLTGIYGECERNCFKARKTSADKTIIVDSNEYYTEASFRAAHSDAIDVFSEKHVHSLYSEVPQAAKNAHAVFTEDGDTYSESGGYYDEQYVWYTWHGYTKSTTSEFGSQSWTNEDSIKNSCTRVQYKSTAHAILSDAFYLLPDTNDDPFQDGDYYYNYGKLSLVSLLNKDYDSIISTHFKGRIYDSIKLKYVPTQTSLQESTWYIAGNTVKLNQNDLINVKWEKADTYFQKYHCLKTYPYSHDSQNNIIDILSFMIYTRVNLNGCYDDKSRNDILHIDNNNFNKLNDVYNQTDNFFTYHAIDESNLNNNFPNLITWGKQKMFGESIDPWTNIHLLNTLDLDGNLGEISSLELWNNKLVAFQQKGINIIKYNENTLLQPINGAPIEVMNSGKVSGKEIISNQFGCQNEWSIVNAKSGLYFSDDYDHKLYVLSDGIKCISDELGFKSYLKNKNYSGIWNPERGTWNDIHTVFTPINTLRTYYDQQLGDIYFTDGSSCLTYNENLNLFTSFYDYIDVENKKLFDFVNIENKNYWILNDFTNNTPLFYEHRAIDNLYIFDNNKDYEIELTANIDSHIDKIFDTVEIRGDSYNTNTNSDTLNSGYGSTPPFDRMRVTNEYQDTNPSDSNNLTFNKDIPSNVKQKFRIWRAQIGRNQKQLSGESTRVTRDRIRNYWSRIKLTKNGTSNLRAKIHDIVINVYE